MTRHRAVLASALFLGFLAAPARSDEPKPAAKPDAGRPHVTLTWSTASEVDNFGYFVMRGEEEKGPFKPLNEKAIPGAGNSDVPRDYRYEDFDVVPGKTYWYFLESVSTAGLREKFSPVLKRLCCKQTVGAPKADESPKADEKKADEKKAPEPRPAGAAEGKR